jgi:hypothetical protein
MQIEVGKTYLDKAGNKVTIVHNTHTGIFHYVGTTPVATRLFSHKGKTYHSLDDLHDLVKEYSPYADWPMDCPVRVRHGDSFNWTHRHFAGTNKNGQPCAWDNGLTSHTAAPYHKSHWNHIERVDNI